MLHFREHDWHLIPGTSRVSAWIRPTDRTHDDIHWGFSFRYVARGAKWRRVQSWHRPALQVAVLNTRPAVHRWTELERTNFWHLPSIDDRERHNGTLSSHYCPRNGEPEEDSLLDDHIWRVHGREGRFLNVELAAFADSRSIASELTAGIAPDGSEIIPDHDNADFWKQNAQLYLIEQIPFGTVTVQLPRNVADPDAYALRRAEALLGLGTPESIAVHDYALHDTSDSLITGDLYAHLHYHGYYED